MIQLAQDIVQVIEDLDIPCVYEVVEAYSDLEQVTGTTVTVREVNNDINLSSSVEGDTFYNLAYQIDIYSRGTVYDDVPTNADKVVKAMANEIADAMSILGLTRVGTTMLPYSVDISRYILRYETIADNEGYLYKTR